MNSIYQQTHKYRSFNPLRLTKPQKILSTQVKDPIEYNGDYYVIKDYEGYNKKVRLLTGNDLHRIKSGIYTWIIGLDNYGNNQLFFKECFSMHELNSKHATIVNEAMYYQPKNIKGVTFNATGTVLNPSSNFYKMREINPLVSLLYSGEFKYDESKNELLLNMYSGTYMYPNFINAANLNASNNVIEIFNSYLKNVKIIKIKAVDYTFMNTKNFDPKTVLKKLLSLGVDILKFRNKDNYLDSRRYLNSLSPIKSIQNKYTQKKHPEKRRRIGRGALKFNDDGNGNGNGNVNSNGDNNSPPTTGRSLFESFNNNNSNSTPSPPRKGRLFSNYNNNKTTS
jgi:hypothetical protein